MYDSQTFGMTTGAANAPVHATPQDGAHAAGQAMSRPRRVIDLNRPDAPGGLDRPATYAGLAGLAGELRKMQDWAQANGRTYVVVMDGPEQPARHGAIQRFLGHFSPRSAKTGGMAFDDPGLCDRSGAEPVLGFCTPADFLDLTRRAPDLEWTLAAAGVEVCKYWISDPNEVRADWYPARSIDPAASWTLSPIGAVGPVAPRRPDAEDKDVPSVAPDQPWVIVRSQDRARARLACVQHFLSALDYPGKDRAAIGTPDRLIVGLASQIPETSVETWDAIPDLELRYA